MNKITQKQRVLDWLRFRGDLSTREAVVELNINCVAKRIEELRKDGYPIATEWKQSRNGARYGVYRLEA